MSAARFVVRTRPKPFVMGLPCVFVIGLLASAIRPRLPVIGADVRQIREPRSGKTANAFDAQGPDGPFLQDLGTGTYLRMILKVAVYVPGTVVLPSVPTKSITTTKTKI